MIGLDGRRRPRHTTRRPQGECRQMIGSPERGRKGLLTMIVYRFNIQHDRPATC